MIGRLNHVAIVTPRDRISSDEALVNRQGIYDRLSKKKVRIITSSEPSPDSAFEEGQVTLRNVYSGEQQTLDDISLFTYATPRVPNVDLVSALEKAGVEVHLIGDAYAPRMVVTATADGNRVGQLV